MTKGEEVNYNSIYIYHIRLYKKTSSNKQHKEYSLSTPILNYIIFMFLLT